MAAEHRPTYNIYVSEPTTAQPAEPFAAGGIGLGSYATQCEYKDISVTTADGKTTRYEPAQLTPKRGKWEMKGDVLSQTSDERTSLAMLPTMSDNDYTVQLKARKTGGLEGFFIFYSLDESGRNGYGVNIGGWNNQTTAVQPMRGGRLTDVVSPRVRQSVDSNKWYDIKLVVKPLSATLYIDGKETTVAKPAEPTRHFCQTGYDEQTSELIIKVVNGTDQPYHRSFTIEGAKSVMPTGRVVTLCGNAQDENTFEQPTKLAPVETRFGKFGKLFEYEFAPMSFTIMRVNVNK